MSKTFPLFRKSATRCNLANQVFQYSLCIAGKTYPNDLMQKAKSSCGMLCEIHLDLNGIGLALLRSIGYYRFNSL
jgi:hypothetical protein